MIAVMKNDRYKFLMILKALSDKTRIDIVLLLFAGEKCVCEIRKHLRLPQNLVSHHLGILRHSGLVINRKDGKWVNYSLNRKYILELRNIIEEIAVAQEIKSKC